MAGSLISSRSREVQPVSSQTTPSWFKEKITPGLLSLSRLASAHPIHTVAAVALLVSSLYSSLLEDSIFDKTKSVAKADWSSLTAGSRRLYAGPQSDWNWHAEVPNAPISSDVDHAALLTLIFPERTDTFHESPATPLLQLPSNLSVMSLPSTSKSFSTNSKEHIHAFSLPYSQASDFLTMVQEVPNSGPGQWIMKNARAQTQNSLADRAKDAWVSFVDLLKNTQTADIAIMLLGYIFMHMTFASLFFSMYRMGSKFWLATSVLFSSTFAFVLGLFVTVELGVPVNMVLLSEGLPFLVVIVGFERYISLTRAILKHAMDRRSPSVNTQSAIESVITDKGSEIAKEYAIEIGILVLGALSGVQGGLQQFCFLAAWTLFFDAIFLFTFYTAIVCIKLEVNQIKGYSDMRKALEDDGISSQTAEDVARSSPSKSKTTLFGKSAHVPRFKVLMVGGFLLVNIASMCMVPFRNTHSVKDLARGLGGMGMSPPVDPFKVASHGLDVILDKARSSGQDTIVTVLAPVKYELHYGLPGMGSSDDNGDMTFTLDGYGIGGRVVGGLLKSLDDPVFCKWVIAALVLSVVLNSHLFSAARQGVKNTPEHSTEAEKPVNVVSRNVPCECQRAVVPTSPAAGGELAIKRTPEEMEMMLAEKRAHELTDEEVVELSLRGKIPGYALEKTLKDFTRAVKVRRAVISRTKATADITNALEHSKLPYENYNWSRVFGACCENVVGYMPVPVGFAGPLVIDGRSYFIPMATTEGVLVASASRGSKAINAGGGAVTMLTADGMTRGPCVSFPTLDRAGAAKIWLDSEEGQTTMQKAFNSTTRFGRLQSMTTAIAGTNLYIRFKSTTGDAMGMNMISKGVEYALEVMKSAGFEDMKIITLSGNFCADKKPAAINWIEGRGKSVVAEAIIPGDVVKSVLKSDVDSMVELFVAKNMIGSAMAGSIGGFNAHAANMVAAIFIATGQDPAQVTESANCITIMKNLHGSLQISVSMPSIEVGTLGGGTILEPQSAMLDSLGIRGSHPTEPGANARQLARIIAAATLAAELSLCAALAAGHLVKAHMQHNRAPPSGGK
ncbi:3-hydroxy-3-methylglutaryl-coenzyme A (HMG-CoA) reductase isozyme [Aspergillus luchuensis]|uniref:3-hydroxy-3-methylglutaryl coenzyme A reductase n=2 Tax=Aspergillus kawachii TaxID=1069201 RepID=A0A7R8A172_ASPKA|nr:3-hydroxy-3-methylglutaryl-coenzyme A (HMG-CoA) reductase isozyme [Aspergillus luchuensis]BCS00760.1 3-hydroxy-3-methylglutaryl-coenzyme A (HMG-CoA) reductase isozyme [Aspergillus luchuensis]BCS12523.1 3-hydroxy-3-methylglutaryl-coenzyme A (HMG-CoA) reductase isozyme [Aspergillus luchuensis]GAA82558.1 3-hydroxy-3-methylglutaryl-coenzyme A reductase [Aspergillus luchuensis IFO 4308]